MKKQSFFISFSVVLLLAGTGIVAQATGCYNLAALTNRKGNAASSQADKVDSRALRHFGEKYKDSRDAEWSVLKDGGYRCHFIDAAGIARWAVYRSDGKWMFTYADYEPDRLPPTVISQIRNLYPAWALIHVKEVSAFDHAAPAYVTEIHAGKDIKMISVCGNELNEITDLRND